METPFDWLTLMVFTGLVVLLLQRSAADNAVVNYLGNEGYVVIAIAGLVAVIAYIYYVLRPKISF